MDYYQLVDKKSLRGLEVVEGVDHLQNHRPEKTGQDLDQVGWSVRHIQQPKVLILICRKYDEQNIFVGQSDILLFLYKSNLYSLLQRIYKSTSKGLHFSLKRVGIYKIP